MVMEVIQKISSLDDYTRFIFRIFSYNVERSEILSGIVERRLEYIIQDLSLCLRVNIFFRPELFQHVKLLELVSLYDSVNFCNIEQMKQVNILVVNALNVMKVNLLLIFSQPESPIRIIQRLSSTYQFNSWMNIRVFQFGLLEWLIIIIDTTFNLDNIFISSKHCFSHVFFLEFNLKNIKLSCYEAR